MTATLVTIAVIVAVVAGFRSTWSPCGLSMLSTITPLAERTRGRRWGVTATWFVLGAAIGGACLGALGAVASVAVAAFGTSSTSALVVALVACVAAAAMDLGMVGPALPHHRRQVDEQWLDQYRGWVYGLGFGAQIGNGLATYIMTAAVYLVVVLAGLTGEPLMALGLGILFGLTRGLAILLGARLTTPDRLRAFHETFEARPRCDAHHDDRRRAHGRGRRRVRTGPGARTDRRAVGARARGAVAPAADRLRICGRRP